LCPTFIFKNSSKEEILKVIATIEPQYVVLFRTPQSLFDWSMSNNEGWVESQGRMFLVVPGVSEMRLDPTAKKTTWKWLQELIKEIKR